MRINICIDHEIFSSRKADERRADRYIKHLEGGGHWRDIGGRRMQHDRDVVSIPVGRRFRLTLNTRTGQGKVRTHEDYNGTKPR